jgi:cytochrome c-type biogenesis protein CcmH
MVSGAQAYTFSSKTNEARYKSFIANTRCMVCQNQNVAESNSMFSDNMKEWLYEAIESGQTDYEIKMALIERFGESVLYSPPLQMNTILLWGLPGVFVILGLLVIANIVKQSRRGET